jgi:hypothetical protein
VRREKGKVWEGHTQVDSFLLLIMNEVEPNLQLPIVPMNRH